jgi:hypothetical protein
LEFAFPGLAAGGFKAIALACSTPGIGKKKFLAVQTVAPTAGRLHWFQKQRKPISKNGGKGRKKIQPQEESEGRRRKKSFQRISGRKRPGRRSPSGPPVLRPFRFAVGSWRGFHHHLVLAVLAYLFVVVVFLGAKKNFWCDVGTGVEEDASVAAEVSRLLFLLRQKI